MARPPDSPPLLAPGRHPMTLDEVRVRCVDAFPLSMTRKTIFRELCELVDLIVQVRLTGELWLNGSFLTTKIDPKDVDVLLWMPPIDNALSTEQEQLLEFIDQNAGKPLVDSYKAWNFPPGHPLDSIGREDFEYWTRQFGKSRQDEDKGIAVIQISRPSSD